MPVVRFTEERILHSEVCRVARFNDGRASRHLPKVPRSSLGLVSRAVVESAGAPKPAHPAVRSLREESDKAENDAQCNAAAGGAASRVSAMAAISSDGRKQRRSPLQVSQSRLVAQS